MAAEGKNPFRKIQRGKRFFFICLGIVCVLGISLYGMFVSSMSKLNGDGIRIVERPSEELAMQKKGELQKAKKNVGLALEQPKAELAEGTQYTEDIYAVEPIDEDVFQVLLLGQDKRSGQGRQRSDAMILVSYNKKDNRVVLTSFMRDMWVPVDGFGWQKLNATYALGGPGLTVNTINQLFGLDINRYISVDFSGMAAIVDALGGLELDITQEESDFYRTYHPENPVVPVGKQVTLTGAQVVCHAQNRFIGNSDFERTSRQRTILLAINQKARQIRNPEKLLQLINVGIENVSTNLEAEEILSLGLLALRTENLDITEARVPFDGLCWDQTEDGAQVLELDFEKNAEKLYEILYPDRGKLR